MKRLFKPLTARDIGTVVNARPLYRDGYDGSRYVYAYRVSTSLGVCLDVNKLQPYCALDVGGFMTTPLNASTWDAMLRRIED